MPCTDASHRHETMTRRRLLERLGVMAAAVHVLSSGAMRATPQVPPRGARLRTKLTAAYGLAHPVVGAGMGFVALPELVAAVSNAGGLGVLGVAPEPPPRWWTELPRSVP